MSIITLEYFEKGSLYIPNNPSLDVGGSNNNIQNDLQLFIDIYERELLINALGIVLYDAYLASPTSTKWVDLINGKTYSVNGKSYRWDGLLGANKQSLLAFYIYCQYLRNGSSIYTTTGVVVPDAANSQSYDPTPKYIHAYNKFIISYQGDLGDYNNCSNNPNVIINASGMVGLDYYGHRDSVFSNMYQYMTDQNTLEATSFPDFEFKFYYKENSWGV